MKFPSIADVAALLRARNCDVRGYVNAGDDIESCDVRLQVWEDGTWTIHTGDSQYDTDHRGYWGAGSLDGKRFNSRALARDLLDQARDQHSQEADE